jgi:hypothetical protein
MSATLVGASIGIVGTLLGALFTSLAHSAREHRTKQKEIKSLLVAIRLEIDQQLHKLASEHDPEIFTTAAFDTLQARGVLGSLPVDISLNLVRVYESFRRVNDHILLMRITAAALIAGSGIEKFGGIGDLRKDIDAARAQAHNNAKDALPLL